jgi:glycosyltransferase involved in cell wall biosynthesis
MVSIIIPIYKAEKFIRRCIDSVLTQTYKDWELILVDDGSPDNSGRICDEYSQKDSRIRVFHKHNGGVSSARNIGLDEARGDRITFIDADDYVFKNYLEVLISSEADLVTCGFKGINKMGSTPKKGYYEGTSFRTNIPIFYNTKQTATPWAKLFKRSIIESNNLRFDQALKLTEDTVFVFHYLAYCASLEEFSEQLYFYDGIWGGSQKYKLTWDEVEYMCDAIFDAVHNLENIFECNINTIDLGVGRIFFVHDLYKNKSFDDCYLLFKKYHPEYSFADYLRVKSSNPACMMISRCKYSLLENRLWQTIKDLKKFATLDSNMLKCISTKDYMLYLLLRSNMLYIAYIYVIFVIFLQYIKNKI